MAMVLGMSSIANLVTNKPCTPFLVTLYMRKKPTEYSRKYVNTFTEDQITYVLCIADISMTSLLNNRSRYPQQLSAHG
jgi:hypothetical protein